MYCADSKRTSFAKLNMIHVILFGLVTASSLLLANPTYAQEWQQLRFPDPTPPFDYGAPDSEPDPDPEPEQDLVFVGTCHIYTETEIIVIPLYYPHSGQMCCDLLGGFGYSYPDPNDPSQEIEVPCN